MPRENSDRYRRRAQGSGIGRLSGILWHLFTGGNSTRHRSVSSKPRSHGRIDHERSPDRNKRAQLPPVERMRIGPWRAVFLAAMAIGSIGAAWRIFTMTASQNLSAAGPDAAFLWTSDQPSALDQLAARELVDPAGDLNAARQWAQRALIANPLDARAISLLGQVAEKQGDRDRASTLMQLSGARGWRDSTVQAWLFDQAVRRGEYSNALPHADAIFRINNDLYYQLFPVIAAFTVDPRAFDALTEFLVTVPAWRTWFLSQLSNRLANRARLVELYAALKKSGSPPTTPELRAFIERLIRDGDFDLAYQTWRERLPAGAVETFPFNRNFEAPIDGIPFNWVLIPIPEADIRIVQSPDGANGRALRIQFFGGRASSTAIVRQLMLLPPGDYILEGRVKADELNGPRGLWWNVQCGMNSPAQSLIHTDLVRGTIPWTNFSTTFTIPSQGCKAQTLQLELPARIASERQLEGQVWFRHLRITPDQAGALPQRAN